MRTRTGLSQALLVVAVLAAGCSGDTDPAPPPNAGTDAETTPDASAPASSEEPTQTDTSSSTTSSTSTDSDDGSIPEMPPEAQENSESGAEAFALHYIDLINATGMNPQVGVLEELAADGCESCANYAGNVVSLAEQDAHNDGPAARVDESQPLGLGDSARVSVQIDQLPVSVVTDEGEVLNEYESIDNVVLVFDLQRGDDAWLINEIRIEESPSS